MIMKCKARVLALLLALLTAFSLTAVAADALTITSATYNGADLEGATVPAGSDVTLIFSNNVTDESVLANNISKIKVKDAEGNAASATVSAGDKNTFVVTLGSDLAKGSYTLTIGKELQAKNGTTLGQKVEYSFTVKGSGTGGGGGDNPLNVESVQVNGEPLEGAELQAGDKIVIGFSRGMTENVEANLALIKVLKEDGTAANFEAAANTDPDNANAKREYIVTLGENESGSLTLVLGKGIKANNGNTLGEDVKVAFAFKAAVEPEIEPSNPTILDRIMQFFTDLSDKFRSFLRIIIAWSDYFPFGQFSRIIQNTLTELFNRLFPKVI